MTETQGPRLNYVQIRTKTSHYVMPKVNLDKYLPLLQPQEYGNPCLQIINEELSVLSVLWEAVEEINISYFMVTESQASYRMETIWSRQSNASAATKVSPRGK